MIAVVVRLLLLFVGEFGAESKFFSDFLLVVPLGDDQQHEDAGHGDGDGDLLCVSWDVMKD